MIDRIGRYRILDKLGEGGMGVVYAAHDDDLDRSVAVKMIRDLDAGHESRERFRREARAAASVNHPNICQLYEIGEDSGALYIAMELLEGQSLAARLEQGPFDLDESVQIVLAMLSALESLHRRGVVHRDLKPSNVFLTPHGVKLLDFGLARRSKSGDATETALTQAGMVVGTPRYLAPEQILGRSLDARTDLFAGGAILFEMLAGKPAFTGESIVQIIHAIANEQPPALAGTGAVAAVDRVIQRSLAKKAEDRWASADAMAQALREALVGGDSDVATLPRARTVTRLIVLPFRILRQDPETDFLSVSLADAISCSLSGFESLVVRSSVTAARFNSDAPDLAAIASQAEVDVVLTGTMLRAGDRLRVNAQLVEAPGGTLISSQTAQMPLEDVFQLQDELARRIVESLALPLTSREGDGPRRDVPASPAAYEYFLRANQYYIESSQWPLARDLFERSVELDPRYAPAWARLGRVYRVLSKYGGAESAADFARAEAAFRRALEINPDLASAHNLFAYHEAEMGHAKEATVRLLERAGVQGADPELFSGLILTTRYCGLLDASVAAYERARRLDPGVPNSVTFTYMMLGDFPRAVETCNQNPPFNEAIANFELGRKPEAIELVRSIELHNIHPAARLLARANRASFEGKVDELLESIVELRKTGFRDPEGWHLMARSLVRVGEHERGIAMLADTIEDGFYCYPALVRDPWLDAVRGNPAFKRVLRRAEERHREAQEAFLAAGGEKVLGRHRN